MKILVVASQMTKPRRWSSWTTSSEFDRCGSAYSLIGTLSVIIWQHTLEPLIRYVSLLRAGGFINLACVILKNYACLALFRAYGDARKHAQRENHGAKVCTARAFDSGTLRALRPNVAVRPQRNQPAKTTEHGETPKPTLSHNELSSTGELSHVVYMWV